MLKYQKSLDDVLKVTDKLWDECFKRAKVEGLADLNIRYSLMIISGCVYFLGWVALTLLKIYIQWKEREYINYDIPTED